MMRWGRGPDRQRRVVLPPIATIAPLVEVGPVPVAAIEDAPTIEDAAPEPVVPLDPMPQPEIDGSAYDRFRREHPIRPPPGTLRLPPEGELIVLVDATVAAPFLIRATLRSLQDQSVRGWQALIVGPAALCDHPVGGFADTDPRIVFATTDDLPATTTHVALLTAGTMLDPEALAWLLFAAARTGAPVVTADHDDGIADPATGPIRAAPQLYGFVDSFALAAGPAPALILTNAATARAAIALDGGEGTRRAALVLALAKGAVPHVPRALATRLHLPPAARNGRDGADDRVPGRLGPMPDPPRDDPPPRAHADRIAIVIPTRDAAQLLGRAIDSLRRIARDASRLDIIVIDNRSTDAATSSLLERLASANAARTIVFDAPFNYSRMCNVGAAASDAPVILFANNDIEMMSEGWDDRLLDLLADPGVGAVGARLLYPNGTIQHAGIAFGFGPNGAEHEGRDRDAADAGPGRRFATTHTVAAVTGAFMGVRRDDFDTIGGFDAGRLMIGHSDIDLCLRLRELGRTIVYCPAIEALHHEGATRGRNETRAAIAWDEGERADLIDRWGDALGEDPSVSPYWTRGGQPFADLSEPAMSAIVRHIDVTARVDRWRPLRRDAQDAVMWLSGESPERA